MKNYAPHTWSATFFVAGCCIGAGMLALPVATAHAGFWPSIAMMALSYVFMTFTALCFIEAGFWMKKDDAHVISMSQALLGRTGKAISWCLYLFICYASLVAYTAGCGDLIAKALGSTKLVSYVGFMAVFGPLLAFSHQTLGRVNSVMFIAMMVAYGVVIAFGTGAVDMTLLARQNWKAAPLGLPLLLTAFSFQTMVPSLHPYLNHDGRSLRFAVITGTSIAFVVYFLWQLIVHGTVPLEGSYGLMEALQLGHPASHSLAHYVNSPIVEWGATFFAFFALITSFFGLGLGLYDFLSDGLKIRKNKRGTLLLTLLIVLPTLFFAVGFERIFLLALDISGGFGDTIQNGLIPLAMVWVGRYFMKKKTPDFRASSGRAALVVAALFYAGTLLLELAIRFGFIT